MEMKQMVYVVIENGYVTGVWNKYQDAENHVGEDGEIIPVVVDTYGNRAGCETPSEVVTAMEHEFQNMYISEDDEEDEDDDDNPFAHIPYDDTLYNGEEVVYQDEEEENDEDEEGDEEDEEMTLTDNDIIRGLLGLLYD